MVRKEFLLVNLFKQFIKESYSGKRLKKDGKKIKPQTIQNYEAVLNLITEFEKFDEQNIRIKTITGRNKRETDSGRKYWKQFYTRFTNFLYKQKNCYDNYVGTVIKTIRIFFNYLKTEKLIAVGEFYKQFYVFKEEIPIVTLLPEQLEFLIKDQNFEQSLTPALRKSKDIFVLGCIVALRYSDLFNIKFTDIERVNGYHYLSVKSIKMEVITRIKLPDYAIKIIERFKEKRGKRKTVLAPISKNQFNKNIRAITEKAGWTHIVGKTRSRRGKQISIWKPKSHNVYRFCDLVSSHTMRRTAVTTMLMLGMPEHVVKKISGHASNSKAFYRYVNLVQSYLDTQVDKVFEKLVNREKFSLLLTHSKASILILETCNTTIKSNV